MLCQVNLYVITNGEIQLDWFINVISDKAIDVITKGTIQLDWFINVMSGKAICYHQRGNSVRLV